MIIVKYRKIFYTLSVFLIAGSIFAGLYWGLKPGIDFSGGSLLSISFKEAPSLEEVKKILSIDFKDASIRASDDGYIIRLKEISQTEKDVIIQSLSFAGKYEPVEKTFSSVGPVLGKEAIQKSWISIWT